MTLDIGHALRVANTAHDRAFLLALRPREAWVAGLLHDVIEDLDPPERFWDRMDLPTQVENALDALTRRDGERYADYIDRCKTNDLARLVKLCDLQDNLRRMDAEHETLRPRYERAIKTITTPVRLGYASPA